jgi:hypothetical protein
MFYEQHGVSCTPEECSLSSEMLCLLGLNLPKFSPVVLASSEMDCISNWSGEPTSTPRLNGEISPVWFETYQTSQSAAFWMAKPGLEPFNLHVLSALARPKDSNLQSWFSGFSIVGRIQISYC